KEKNISSYYMIELSGSFLLINDEGKLSWLIVKTKKDIDEYVDFMKDSDMPENLIGVIERGEKIPYFNSGKDYIHSIDPSFQLEKHLYTAKKLEGQIDYYYSFTDTVYDFPLDKAVMFKAA
ncbi:MAG: hypothetical protein K2Q33_01700, partial [Gammaproteobacteria bacterium]|nr:hypothetical protein [Gammaproteobacteria bacterium]